jgi:hypothetical protein
VSIFPENPNPNELEKYLCDLLDADQEKYAPVIEEVSMLIRIQGNVSGVRAVMAKNPGPKTIVFPKFANLKPIS